MRIDVGILRVTLHLFSTHNPQQSLHLHFPALPPTQSGEDVSEEGEGKGTSSPAGHIHKHAHTIGRLGDISEGRETRWEGKG